MEGTPKFNDENIEVSEGKETQKSALFEAFRSTAERAQKWLSMIGVAAVMSGGAFAADRLPMPRSRSEPAPDKKAKRESVSIRVETGGSFEFDQIEKTETICRNAGFDIDQYDYAVSTHLPPEKVENVVIEIAQLHKGEKYDKKPAVFDQIVKVQKNIFNLIENASERTRTRVKCMVEGIVSDVNADYLFPSPEAASSFQSFVTAVATNDRPISEMVDWELDAMKDAVEGNAGIVDKKLSTNLGLFAVLNLSRIGERLPAMPEASKKRLSKFNSKMAKHVDEDVLMYEYGGAGMASACGYATIRASESAEANRNVFVNIGKELGFDFGKGENFYDVLATLPKDKQAKAGALITKHALSKERERSVVVAVERNLRDANSVVLVFGRGHSFENEFDEMYKNGRMRNTALVKIDAEAFTLMPRKK